MAPVSPSVSALQVLQLQRFGRIPFEFTNHGMSCSRIAKKLITVQRMLQHLNNRGENGHALPGKSVCRGTAESKL